MSEILVVDDERVLREGIRTMLSGEGFEVRTARDGSDALKKIAEKRPDLVLLDVMMPRMNGFLVCEEIRKSDALLPVIFLTARDAESDQVRAIGLGGDDYISKAEGEAVLLARIRRALERARSSAAVANGGSSELIHIGEVVVDLRRLTVSDARREIANLTKTEASILKLLDSERGQPFSVGAIISALRGNGYACEDAMVYTHVSNLRSKLGPSAGCLTTYRRSGYCLSR